MIYLELHHIILGIHMQAYFFNLEYLLKVAERLGHTSTAITDRIYSHVMPEEKEKQRISSLNSSVLINAQTKAQTFTISIYKRARILINKGF